MVPNDFPKNVKINVSLSKETNVLKFQNLHPEYRKFTDNKEFLFFVENILAKINPKYSNFEENKTKIVISQIFTITDEAFALTMVLNQCANWKELAKDKNKRSRESLKKLFTRPISGCRNSWNMEGQMIFYDVQREIKKLRENPETGIKFETNLMQHYQASDEKYILEQEMKYKRDKTMMGLAAALDESFFDGDDLFDFLKESENDTSNIEVSNENNTELSKNKIHKIIFI